MTALFRKKILLSLCTLLLISGPSWGRASTIMPAPQKAPRVPVSKETLPAPTLEERTSLIKGTTKILSNDVLQVGATKLRLFGLASTKAHTNTDNQAQALLENLSQGQITCQLRRLGTPFLASCENEEGQDLAQELLKRGLAVTDRGALRESNLALAYISAEEAAKAKQLALWKEVSPHKVSAPATKTAANEMNVSPVASQANIMPQEKPALAPISAPAPSTIVNLGSQQGFPEKQNIAAVEEISVEDQPTLAAPAPEVSGTPLALPYTQQPAGFVERYQFLLTGFMLLLAAMVASGSFIFLRMKERREELQAIAAAMRGELMSMRAICLARLSKMAHDTDGKVTSWPRFRTFIFKAHVTQIGRLGADLARQVSSIYGQASDYAAYYMSAHEKPEQASKKQAMQTLVSHIEEVVPRLAAIENTGVPPHAMTAPKLLTSFLARALPPKGKKPTPPLPPKGGHKAKLPAPGKKQEALQESPRLPKRVESEDTQLQEAAHTEAQEMMESEESIMADAPEGKAEETEAAKETTQTDTAPEIAPSVKKLRRKQTRKGRRLTGLAAQQASFHKQEETRIEAGAPEKTAPAEAKEEAVPEETSAEEKLFPEVQARIAGKKQAPQKEPETQNGKNWAREIKDSVFESLAAVQSFAFSRFDSLRKSPSSSLEDIIPDYANLTEEELEALSYEDADLFYDEEYDTDFQKTA